MASRARNRRRFKSSTSRLTMSSYAMKPTATPLLSAALWLSLDALCHGRQGAVVRVSDGDQPWNPRKGRPDQDRSDAGDGDDDAGEQHLVHWCGQQQETADAEHPPYPQAQLLVDDVVVTHRLWCRIAVDPLEG